jgi:hypothetical protein
MYRRAMLLVLLTGFLAVLPAFAEQPRLPLRILYVGNDKARGDDYAALLNRHFAEVRIVGRTIFQQSDARTADVVLLDWSQAESSLKETAPPFGKPEEWSKPTVLLGSAGLLLAGQWQIMGGAG